MRTTSWILERADIALGVCAIACLVLASNALAAYPGGSIGVFFDPAGTQTTTTVNFLPPSTTFHVYMVAFEPPADIAVFEFGLQWSIPADVQLSIGSTMLPSGFLPYCDPDPPCTIAGGDACLAAAPAVVLGHWEISAWTPIHNVQFRATAPALSDFNPPSPGMLICGGHGADDMRSFTFAYDGWATVNATVASETSTWGTVKALFAD
jgi:hypothetical protein